MVTSSSCCLRACASTLRCSLRNSLSNIAFTLHSAQCRLSLRHREPQDRGSPFPLPQPPDRTGDAVGVNLVLVAESHRLQREYGFTRLIHRFDRIFKTLRGSMCGSAVPVYNYRHTLCKGAPKCPRLLSGCELLWCRCGFDWTRRQLRRCQYRCYYYPW